MNGRLQPWTLFIDAKVVLAVIAGLLVAILIGTVILRLVRAAKRPQDEG